MADRGVKIFAQQAEQLYLRGSAAARGGQKALAERLLRQAVKLNPQHEQAWLWLSGVLEQPEDVAFCLRAVLSINPNNERARRGLDWIEQHNSQTQAVHPASIALSPAPTERDQWWATWRKTQTTWLWTIRVLLLIPIILIGSTLVMRAVITAQPMPTFATVADIPIPTVVIEPTPVPPTPTIAPTRSTRAALVDYFSAMIAERESLRAATDAYRETTDNSRTAIQRVTATRQLRDQIQRSHESIAKLSVPPEAASLHQLYLEGLTLEQEALDLLLEYYQTYETARANESALRLQEARAKIAQAVAEWHIFGKEQGLGDVPAIGVSYEQVNKP